MKRVLPFVLCLILLCGCADDGKSQFLEFVKRQGCIPYFSFEEMRDGKLYGAMFIYNKETGYDHIFSLECDVKDIATNKLVLNSRAYLYTPTTNVKNLYNDIKTKKSK